MKRDRLDFYGVVPQLRDLYFNAAIYGPRYRLVPCLGHSLEVAYMTGALEALGLAMGYCGDDIRPRCLALQWQAAQRLAELREARNGFGRNTPQYRANRTIKRRTGQHDKRFR